MIVPIFRAPCQSTDTIPAWPILREKASLLPRSHTILAHSPVFGLAPVGVLKNPGSAPELFLNSLARHFFGDYQRRREIELFGGGCSECARESSGRLLLPEVRIAR